MTILITGIHGFVGTNLVKALAANNQIYGLDIIFPDKGGGILKTYSWQDLADDMIPAVDAIIHLAGKAHDTKNQGEAQTYFDINTSLTQRVFDYFSAHTNINKFIFFSSVKAAADKVDGDVLTEDVVPAPKGPYGESKIKAEEYIISTISANPQVFDNREVIILRPCMIHGEGNKGNLNLLYGVVSKGIPWPLGAFDNRRTFTSVDNLCFVVGGLLSDNVPSGIYHMADDEALSTNELIELICECRGKRPRIWHVSRGFMQWCARVGGLFHLPLNSERLSKLTETYVVSNAKIKNALHIESMPVRARDGIIKTIRSFEK